jgi:hypothetical protein
MMFRVIVTINSPCMPTQGDSGGRLIFGGDSEKKFHMNMCLVLDGYRDRDA